MVVELYRSGQPFKQLSGEYGVSEVFINGLKYILLSHQLMKNDRDANAGQNLRKEALRLLTIGTTGIAYL